MILRSICVYCGSNAGLNPSYARAAALLGSSLAQRNITLVYGGGRVGLMGILAEATLAAGGDVVGVITESLVKKEIAHQHLTELCIVKSMHERKAVMADRSDAFVMLPGGFGTLDEFFEALTWAQLGIHDKPCGVLDVHRFFQPLLDLVALMVEQRFVRPEHARMVIVESDVPALLQKLEQVMPVHVDKWLDKSSGGPFQ